MESKSKSDLREALRSELALLKEPANEHTTGLPQNELALNTYARLSLALGQYEYCLLNEFLALLKSPMTTAEQLRNLNEELRLCEKAIAWYSSNSAQRFNIQAYLNRKIICMTTDGVKLSIDAENPITPYIGIPIPTFVPDRSLITWPLLLCTPASNIQGKKGFVNFSFFSDLFKIEFLDARIILAVIFDNVAVLNIFFEEHKSKNREMTLVDKITQLSLIGIAAANGCIEVLKFFIGMKINLEQKFTINIGEKRHLNCDSKSVLTKYENCALEMTALALAISAAPALPREKAYELIDILVSARANYNNKVIQKYNVVRGYYNAQRTDQHTKQINLFEFDQTGILDEIAKKTRANKGEGYPHKSHEGKQHRATHPHNAPGRDHKHHQGKHEQSAPSSAQPDELASLRAEVAALREDNRNLWAAIKRLEQNAQLTGSRELDRPRQADSAGRDQAFFTGRK